MAAARTNKNAPDQPRWWRTRLRCPWRSLGAGVGGSSYGFADTVGQTSSRPHIEGVIEDLRLEPARRERALAIGKASAATLEETATGELLAAVKPLLSPEQLTRFTDALQFSRPGAGSAPLVATVDGHQLQREELAPASFSCRTSLDWEHLT